MVELPIITTPGVVCVDGFPAPAALDEDPVPGWTAPRDVEVAPPGLMVTGEVEAPFPGSTATEDDCPVPGLTAAEDDCPVPGSATEVDCPVPGSTAVEAEDTGWAGFELGVETGGSGELVGVVVGPTVGALGVGPVEATLEVVSARALVVGVTEL